MVWCGVVWCGWCGVVGVVWCGVVGVVWCGLVWLVWCGVVWCGVVWCGVVGVVWCGVVWCGVNEWLNGLLDEYFVSFLILQPNKNRVVMLSYSIITNHSQPQEPDVAVTKAKRSKRRKQLSHFRQDI